MKVSIVIKIGRASVSEFTYTHVNGSKIIKYVTIISL